jgi:hypothetical protein
MNMLHIPQNTIPAQVRPMFEIYQILDAKHGVVLDPWQVSEH